MKKIKKIPFLLISIAALVIVGIILVVNFNKKEEIQLLTGQTFRYFNCNINSEIKDNKIEYTIDISPRYEKMKYEDVKIIFNISGSINSTINDRSIMQPIKFESEEIILDKNGKYTGTFIYEDDSAIYNESDRNRLNLFVKKAEGKIFK